MMNLHSLWMLSIYLLFIVFKSSNADCFSSLGMASRAIKDHQITASSTFSVFTKPETARLRNQRIPGQLNFGGWCAEGQDIQPYLQIDFQKETIVRELATQGLEAGNWVTQYAVNYSCDGVTWSAYKDEGQVWGQKVFKGNNDDSTVVKNYLKRPIIARIIRFRPLNKKQHGYFCMRVDMYGCHAKQGERFAECSVPAGMEDNRIQSHQVTASSYSQSHLPSYARLNNKMKMVNGNVTWGAWCSSKVLKQQYLQIDLGRGRTISGVATQGYGKWGWVTKYKIDYSLEEKDWETYRDNGTKIAKVFAANWDAETIVKSYFDRKLRARYVRFVPVAWKKPGSICMRVEVYECIFYEGCPKIDTTLTPTGSQSYMTRTPSPTGRPTEPIPTRRSDEVVQQVNSIASLNHVGYIFILVCFICSLFLC